MDVPLEPDALEVLAPAAVGILVSEQELAAAQASCVIALAQPGALQALQGKHGGIGETDAPGADPAALWELRCEEILDAAAHASLHVERSVLGVRLLDRLQTHEHRGGALWKQVVRHDVFVELRDVEALEGLGRPDGLKGRVAAAPVLHAQNQVDGFEYPVVRDEARRGTRLLQLDDAADRLGRRVRHGVGLVARAKGPRTLGRLAIAVRRPHGVLSDLRGFDELERLGHDIAVLGPLGQTAVERRLHREDGVPERGAVGAGRGHALSAHPHGVDDALAHA